MAAEGEHGERRLRGKELSVPIVLGTIAFYLGKKATESQSHRWTAYLRSANGEDLSHIFKKIVIVLHASFNNPQRAIEYPPWELTETGWGEFDIGMQASWQAAEGFAVNIMHFHDDAMIEKPLELYHRLRLYDETGASNPKKPVVAETYEELVVWEPAEAFYNRVMATPPRAAPTSQLAQFHTQFNPDVEYRKIQAARHRVAQITANVRAQLAHLEVSS
ncbi:hypothetical protein N2152v2_002053 [Parachlorella kessleri]